eukprot:813420_1
MEEAAQSRLIPHLPDILSVLMMAFQKYHERNLFIVYDAIVYDAIQTLAESVRGALATEHHMKVLVPPLMVRWSETALDDRHISPVMECLTTLAISLGVAFAPFAQQLFMRSVEMVKTVLLAAKQSDEAHLSGRTDIPDPDKDFAVCALDMLSGLCTGLGSSVAELVGRSGLVELVYEAAKDENADVRQSAFALLGDLVKVCIKRIIKSRPEWNVIKSLYNKTCLFVQKKK